MTRGRDIFWGVLAAITPILFTVGIGYAEQIGRSYISHTFHVWSLFLATIGINIVYGIVMAALAVRFGGKQQAEISYIPIVGMLIGWLYSICNVVVFFLVYSGIRITFGVRMIMYSGARGFFFAAFYSILLLLYRKRYDRIEKENFISEEE